MEQKPQHMQIKASEKDLKGLYANAMQVRHTQEEFVLDFLTIVPPAGTLAARIIVTPARMKGILQALSENMKKYEAQFGPVVKAQESQERIGFQ